ncbi:MAG: hypothetical protein EXR43_03655 [Dehalococcoidia bacterium]|nr:hypothetical protein [Dehalococcoidia bacterium]
MNDSPGASRSARQARRSVTRTALFYTPLFLIALGAFFYLFQRQVEDGSAGWVAVVIVGLAAVLFGVQAMLALRDLGSGLTETRGRVIRKWTRSEMLVSRGHFLRVEGDIFRVSPLIYREILENDDVIVLHLPHTNTVESVRRTSPGTFSSPAGRT